jgi:PhzF family phenazine biosynthesis protein
MDVQRLASFSDGLRGGNPAGVVIADALPSALEMQRIARDVGYSETAFACRPCGIGDGWRVRYFSPEAEVPFCGHATIALGAALAMREGDGTFSLQLNEAAICVVGRRAGDLYTATLTSPPTRSVEASDQEVAAALALFGLTTKDLDPRIAPARIHAGADHLLLLLASRATLAAMRYDLARGRELMQANGWVTILLAYAETPRLFHTRNPFAYGGVYEDPATGAASAALGGHLRTLDWPHDGSIEIHQGDDMRAPSRIAARIPSAAGSGIDVSGTVRPIG